MKYAKAMLSVLCGLLLLVTVFPVMALACRIPRCRRAFLWSAIKSGVFKGPGEVRDLQVVTATRKKTLTRDFDLMILRGMREIGEEVQRREAAGEGFEDDEMRSLVALAESLRERVGAEGGGGAEAGSGDVSERRE